MQSATTILQDQSLTGHPTIRLPKPPLGKSSYVQVKGSVRRIMHRHPKVLMTTNGYESLFQYTRY